MISGFELLEALPVAVYTTDADGRITYYNQAAADLWGDRPELGRDRWCGSIGPTGGLCRMTSVRWPWR
jgi:PAS domain-containing protein